jgi:serine/threonine protein kinase/WD40 repeat protein
MNDKLNSAFMDDPEFQSLMVDCLEALQRGESIDRDALREKFPKYADDLDQYLDVLNVLDQFAGGLPQLNSSGDPSSPYEATVTPHTGNSDVESGDTIRYIGEYEVLEEIARGGMGVVFKARQQTLKRIVALKMILSGRLADTAEVDRFKREAQAASRLQHPNIVPVHEIGEHEGRQYFTMDYVDGHSLADEIREESLAPKRAARLVKTVAEAVRFAHGNGTLHRDLKPANVLITSDDVPHVTDFGLAKILDDVDDESRAELTASGQILGTPSYMAPEQAAGNQNLVGPASDIYSLGAILYACLTGRAPFVADSPVDTLMQVIHQEPVSPRQLNPAVPVDLETICLKCLNKEPGKRYETAQGLADDLGRFLEGRPVLARPVGQLARACRWMKRNPWIAALLLLSTTLLAGGTVVSTNFAIEADRRADAEAFQRNRADREAERYRNSMLTTERALQNEQRALSEAEQERDLANLRLKKLSRALYAARLDGVYDLWRANWLDASRQLSDEEICPPKFRDFSWRYLNTITDWASTKWILEADQTTPDSGKFKVPLVSRTRVGVFQPDIGSPVAVIDVPSGESFDVVAYAADGKYVAAASGTIITIWETGSGRVIQEIEQESDVNCMEFTAAPHRLVTGGKGLIIWNIENGKATQRLGDESQDITHLSVSADGTQLLSATDSGLIQLWEPGQEQPLSYTISENEEGISQLLIAPDSRHYMICSAANFRMCDLQTGEIQWKLDQPYRNDEKWRFAVFSDDSRFVVTSGGRYHTPTFWDTKSGEKQIAHKAMRLSQDVQFTANGRRLVSRNQRGWGYVQRIPPPEGSLPIETPAYEKPVIRGQQSALSPDGRWLAVAAGQEKLQMYELQTQRLIRTIDGVSVRHLAWSPNGVLLAGLLENGGVVVWEAATGEPLHRRETPPTRGKGLVFIDGDDQLAFPTRNMGMIIWNLTTDETFEKTFGRYPVYSLAVSPDGRYLAAGTGFFPIQWPSPKSVPGKGRVAGKVYVWDLETLEQIAELNGHEQFGVNDLAFSPDGRTLASASNNVILWNVETFQKRETISWLNSDLRSVWSVDFSPDGKTLATASDDGSLRLWDPVTGVQRLALIEAIPVFTGGGTLTSRVEFTSDGEWLVSTWLGYKIQLWPADAGRADLTTPDVEKMDLNPSNN